MYYINSVPSRSGDYGNPMGQPFPGCIILPDELLNAYIEAKAFVIPTVENGVVKSLEVNQEALDAYNREHPEIPVEPEPTETEKLQAEVTRLKAQNELQAQHQTFLEDCLLEMGSIVYA